MISILFLSPLVPCSLLPGDKPECQMKCEGDFPSTWEMWTFMFLAQGYLSLPPFLINDYVAIVGGVRVIRVKYINSCLIKKIKKIIRHSLKSL